MVVYVILFHFIMVQCTSLYVMKLHCGLNDIMALHAGSILVVLLSIILLYLNLFY